MHKRTYTIYFRKTIVDKWDGTYTTPSTDQVREMITDFCATNNIKMIELCINSPFETSTIKIRSTLDEANAVFNFLVAMQDRRFFSTVFRHREP